MTDETAAVATEQAADPPARTRAHLLELHRSARQRRDAAPPGSEAFKEAVIAIAEIEVEIAAIETGVPPSRR